MGVTVDVTFKSLNKYSEILCGDTVECLKTEDSDVIILADGMGSGVKANILSTLTAKILGTMFLNGATLEECVETIVQTLPICQTRQVAYATFSILQIFNNGEVYLVEYDNPRCIFLRCGHVVELRILVSGEAGPAVRCTFPADMECRARNLLQYLYENTVMPSQAADVLADCCTVGQVEVLNAGC